MATPSTVRCESCGVPIFWAMSATTGKRMPIDERPADEGGNVVLNGDPRSLGDRVTLTAEVLGPLEALTHDGPLYVSHFSTCPEAASWRDTTREDLRRARRPHKEHA